MGLGAAELIFLFLVILLLFGAKRLPEIGSSLGKGIREFKTSFSEIEREFKAPIDRQLHPAMTPPGEGEPSNGEDGEPKTLSDSMPAVQQ
jgi:sec-independent protein translocase protein TatA